jgi:hypothetical protein
MPGNVWPRVVRRKQTVVGSLAASVVRDQAAESIRKGYIGRYYEDRE